MKCNANSSPRRHPTMNYIHNYINQAALASFPVVLISSKSISQFKLSPRLISSSLIFSTLNPLANGCMALTVPVMLKSSVPPNGASSSDVSISSMDKSCLARMDVTL
uniref:Uncharacterized protein n=1 Tax=Ditylum brightwellii TaxID=49249 RepID=A0A7S4T675_9STRA|mmetsp:Transcript_11219/g.16531  ORF Transcript_11219/g.16531 Transcript_11219/m.16531 type:complete len:107 (-) Transcript_11219:483-803(-)